MYCNWPAWVHKTLRERSLLGLVLDVHMTTLGSYPRYDDSQEQDLKALRHIYENWTPNQGLGKEFDRAVFELVRVTLVESNVLTNTKV